MIRFDEKQKDKKKGKKKKDEKKVEKKGKKKKDKEDKSGLPVPLRQIENAQEEADRRGLPVLTPRKWAECDSQGNLIHRSRSGRIIKRKQRDSKFIVQTDSSDSEG